MLRNGSRALLLFLALLMAFSILYAQPPQVPTLSQAFISFIPGDLDHMNCKYNCITGITGTVVVSTIQDCENACLKYCNVKYCSVGIAD